MYHARLKLKPQEQLQIEWRKQGKTNRQVGDEPIELEAHLKNTVYNLQKLIKSTYDTLVQSGIAKECARMILPLNTQTTIYMTGSLRSWIHYLELRCAVETQKEHRDIALDIKKRLEKLFPKTFINTHGARKMVHHVGLML